MTVTMNTDGLACMGCGAGDLVPVLNLGVLPLANNLLDADQVGQAEETYPLEVVMCPECALVQLTVSVPPEKMFSEYAYLSSYAPGVVANAKELVERVVRERNLGPDNMVMEIASNDGYLLRGYVDAGIPVLGIDPARNIAEVAEERGVPTLVDFFGERVGKELRAAGKWADVIHANNVMAHVPDINGVMRGIQQVLSDSGVAIIETPYVRDLVEELEFDTIYHEHLFYYSLTALDRLFRRNGLAVVDVEKIPIHGGSLRVTAALEGRAEPSEAVRKMLADEQRDGLDGPDYYRDFAARVESLCDSLRKMLTTLKAEGKTLACYGAAAKGDTMLNTLRLGRETFDFVADRSTVKQGRLMPGAQLSIVDVDELVRTMPDYVLILAWNFAAEIMEQQAEYTQKGGRWIVPVPEPAVHPA